MPGQELEIMAGVGAFSKADQSQQLLLVAQMFALDARWRSCIRNAKQ